MAKTNTLQAQVAAAAKAVPREPLMDALALAMRKTMPRAAPRPTPSPLRQAVQALDDAKPKRMRRMSRVGFRKYKVLMPEAARRHNARTWTRFMLETILGCEDTRQATAAHKISERYPEKTLDFNWCVKQGYIAYE